MPYDDPRNVLIWMSALCGVLMVAGALGLLYKGLIKLEAPKRASRTELDVFKILKLKTNIAALVLFAFGFAFLALGFYHSSPKATEFLIAGQVVGVSRGEHVRVTVCAGPWEVPLVDRESFRYPIKPDLDSFTVQIGRIGSNVEKTIGVVARHVRGSDHAKYGFVQVDKRSVANLGEIKLDAAGALPAPVLVDRVSDRPAPVVSYGQ